MGGVCVWGGCPATAAAAVWVKGLSNPGGWVALSGLVLPVSGCGVCGFVSCCSSRLGVGTLSLCTTVLKDTAAVCLCCRPRWSIHCRLLTHPPRPNPHTTHPHEHPYPHPRTHPHTHSPPVRWAVSRQGAALFACTVWSRFTSTHAARLLLTPPTHPPVHAGGWYQREAVGSKGSRPAAGAGACTKHEGGAAAGTGGNSWG